MHFINMSNYSQLVTTRLRQVDFESRDEFLNGRLRSNTYSAVLKEVSGVRDKE
jgi:hypothetical protein